jgi:hypothetical protein
MTWRDILDVHPAAVDLFDPLSEDELKALAEDIKKNGLQEPVTITNSPREPAEIIKGRKPLVVDGVNRLNALDLIGEELVLRDDSTFCFRYFDSDAEIYEFVWSANFHRRHLDAAGKRKGIEVLLKANPKESNRQIAETAKASHHTVKSVRTKMESTGQIAQLPKTVGKDGKERPTRPASKARRTPAAGPGDEQPVIDVPADTVATDREMEPAIAVADMEPEPPKKVVLNITKEHRPPKVLSNEETQAAIDKANADLDRIPNFLRREPEPPAEDKLINQQLADVKASIERLVGHARSCNKVPEIISVLRAFLSKLEDYDAKVARPRTGGAR